MQSNWKKMFQIYVILQLQETCLTFFFCHMELKLGRLWFLQKKIRKFELLCMCLAHYIISVRYCSICWSLFSTLNPALPGNCYQDKAQILNGKKIFVNPEYHKLQIMAVLKWHKLRFWNIHAICEGLKLTELHFLFFITLH